ncbi:MAG: MFS transporter [Acidobacteria bacterium]|nr:MFS transporter [Acidobacteriota bacterium]
MPDSRTPSSACSLPPSTLSGGILALLAISVFINYVDRGNLSIAGSLVQTEFQLSPSQLGILLSSFFLTYAFFQIPSGWLVDRFDVKWVLAGGFALWSIATALTGVVHGFAAMLVIRLLLGIGESVAYPSYANILSRHFPEHRRGLANAVIAAGQTCGPAFAMFAGGMLISQFGWRPFFMGLGLVSLLWLWPWLQKMPPREPHPHTRATGSSFLPVLRQRSAWGTCIGLFSGNYVLYFLLTWLPFYLQRARGFSLAETAKLSGAFFLLMATSALIVGKVSDSWIARGGSPTLVRKLFLCSGTIGVCSLLLLSSVMQSNLFVVPMLLASVLYGFYNPHVFAVSQTMAGPKMAGRWVGVQNFAGNLAGISAPSITGWVVDRTGHFFWAFVVATVVGGMGVASWLWIVGRVEPVDWNQDPQPTIELEALPHAEG